MARQFAGAATFEFRRDGEAWLVAGHFFDDIGRWPVKGEIWLDQSIHPRELPFILVHEYLELRLMRDE